LKRIFGWHLNLIPGNYTAYDVYFYFLTNEVTQTEFASLAGAQLKDEDDDEAPDQGGSTQKENNSSPTTAAKAAGRKQSNQRDVAESKGAFEPWAEQERQRRNTRAVEITDEAIRKFRSSTMDPERFLTAAVMWYNRFMLLAPDSAEREKSAEARRKFAELGPLTLSKMTYYIDGAKTCQHDMKAKRVMASHSERRAEFLRVLQLIDKCAFTLSSVLRHNHTQMSQDRPGSNVWAGPLGKN
jgi:hypothetical protein